MRLPLFLLPLLLNPLSVRAESASKWTKGLSVCDPVQRQLVDTAAVDRRAFEQAIEYAVQDADSLAELGCFPEAAAAAAEFSARLRVLQADVLPGVKAASCEAPGRKDGRLAGATALRMRGTESFFVEAFGASDGFQRQIATQIPAEGLPFDDCRAKAQRGWARVRASLNKLSCEVSAAVDRLESMRDRTDQASLECPAPSALAQVQANDAAAAMVVSPSGNGGYQAFPGAPAEKH
jgi:hypothetical protein